MANLSYSGPVDYAVFEVPRGARLGEAFRALLARIDAGAIELLDLEIIERGDDGRPLRRSVTVLETGDEFDLEVFVGADSGLLDDEDLALIVAELDTDSRAVVVVYEDRNLADVAERLGAAGGRMLWSGGIDIVELEERIVTTEVDPV